MEFSAPERVVQLRDVVEQEAGAGCVRLDNQRLILEVVKILFDFLIAGLWLQLDLGQRARQGNFPPFALLASHQALDVLGLGGLDSISVGGLEKDARIAERDRLVSIVGDDQAHGHDPVTEIIDSEDGLFFLCVVGLGGDSDFFVGVNFDIGKGSCGLHGRRSVVAGTGRQSQAAEKSRAGVTRAVNGFAPESLIVLDCIILDWTAERRVRHA